MNKLQIEIQTSSLSPAFRKKLIGIIEEHPGDTPLALFLKDDRTGHRIEFDSRKYKVSDSGELKAALSQIGVEIVTE